MKDVKKKYKNKNIYRYRYMNTSAHISACLPKLACRHLHALTQTLVQSVTDLKIGTPKTNTVTPPTMVLQCRNAAERCQWNDKLTLQNQIRVHLQEQSEPGLHCLSPICPNT